MKKNKRTSKIKRKTSETEITGLLALEGDGRTEIKTGIGFLDHMLTLFAFHGLFDLTLEAKGDLDVDMHHTNEDIAICLGKALKDALGDCVGIRRYGSAEVPMDLARAKIAIDIGGRDAYSGIKFVNRQIPPEPSSIYTETEGKRYSLADGNDFFETFAKSARINLHAEVSSGEDAHHILEALFKALGIALDQATQIDPRRKGVPSTKGVID
ncbi:MAG: imidazoleglycerol-phosphate dehydratase [Candidatus Omnitrophota bacterium]